MTENVGIYASDYCQSAWNRSAGIPRGFLKMFQLSSTRLRQILLTGGNPWYLYTVLVYWMLYSVDVWIAAVGCSRKGQFQLSRPHSGICIFMHIEFMHKTCLPDVWRVLGIGDEKVDVWIVQHYNIVVNTKKRFFFIRCKLQHSKWWKKT